MAETIGTAYVQIEPSFEGSVPKIDKEFGGEGQSAGKSFASGFASVMGTSAKVMFGAVAAGSTMVAGLVKTATESFGEYEQLVGGVETLFGDSADIVMQNASNAFATAGMSANEYMETVTSFSASLLQSLGGDTEQAAKAADMALSDMADNANKMGSSMESIQAAYQGFSKGQYQLLDNLKLGYGGTRTEMERLLADASKLSGQKYDISNLSDVYEAIHVIQNEMGITGTTAREASTTIQGSLASLAASWQNVLTGMGDKDADMGALIGTLVQNAETFIGNLTPVIEQALMGISTMIAELGPVIAEKLPALIQSVLPMLLTSATQIIETLAQGLIAAIPVLLPTITEVVVQLGTMLVSMLPQIIELGAQLILSLATGIAEALPDLIPTIIEVVVTIVEYLLENIDLLIDCAGQLITGLAVGLVNAIPILIEKVPVLISSLVKALIGMVVKLVEVGVKMVVTIKDAVVNAWPQIVSKAKELFEKLKSEILTLVNKFTEIGKNIVDGIKKGISDAWEGMTKWFAGLLNSLVDGVKDFFGIGSPSKLMAEEVGQWIPAGIALGIQEGMKSLDSEFANMGVNMAPARLTAQSINTYTPDTTGASDPDTQILGLLARYLPIIAQGDNVNISLEGDMGRLFRAMQRESIRNTQLVGNGAVLAAT